MNAAKMLLRGLGKRIADARRDPSTVPGLERDRHHRPRSLRDPPHRGGRRCRRLVRRRVLPRPGPPLPDGDPPAGGPRHRGRTDRRRRRPDRSAQPRAWDCAGSERRRLPPSTTGTGRWPRHTPPGSPPGRPWAPGGRPYPFVLLRTRPTPYEAADAMGFLALMSFSLASNWDAELARLKMLTLDGPGRGRGTRPRLPGVAAGHLPAGAAHRGRGRRQAGGLPRRGPRRAGRVLGLGGGSNNWAVSGSRTATGRPLLANDPHLAPVLPSHWYLVHVRTPEWSVAGASMPGDPGGGRRPQRDRPPGE